jgi:aspartate 1-decarboxylase
MNVTMLRSKIHRAKVTEANLRYEGSISVCPELIAATGLLIHEQVDIYNCNNGARFTTYVIEGEKGQICLNGAAARHVQVDDLVIICAYSNMDLQEAKRHVPTVVFVDGQNRAVENRQEIHGTAAAFI